MQGLQDKIIIVAGGATGIGAAVADRLSREGAKVVIGDVNIEKAEATAARLSGAGGNVTATGFDITDDDSVAELIESVVRQHGRLDGLHANAADLSARTFGRDDNATNTPDDVWDRTLDVALKGHFYLVRHAVPAMLANGGGAIVHTSSTAAFMGEPTKVAYGVAKAGVTALMRHTSARWGKDGIRSNAVAPGLTRTEVVLAEASERPEWHEKVRNTIHSDRLGLPEDIASAVSFLLSEDASWITGQVYSVDGGQLLR
ncbi:SDR family NAD(P)-dependent oxidoreductase [Subtercola lobariae]|uniref:Short-chain type dehydrogenase/reductase y4lA n=1 Tax=Subtercola lobariae TaxID=1588641 RepID=A0A917BD01_9MICO|nr:SDR family NAD(P)-dependent oxidoreductase [Subtercola lobariae]GGF38046.1 putative short-chain type dehydrogenase/reductase y4lA [Subtercola lobariae]